MLRCLARARACVCVCLCVTKWCNWITRKGVGLGSQNLHRRSTSMSSILPPKMASLATSGLALYAKMFKQSWLNISITAWRKCTKFGQQIGLYNLYQVATFNVSIYPFGGKTRKPFKIRKWLTRKRFEIKNHSKRQCVGNFICYRLIPYTSFYVNHNIYTY